jgi:orotidine-5'-phosphate decarboxylase
LKDKIILAVDNLSDILLAKKLEGEIGGVKVGLPVFIRAKEEIKINSELIIADLKLADIGSIMVENVFASLEKINFNKVIAHSFVGYEGALEELSLKLRESGIDLILVISMSHKGWPWDNKIKDLLMIKERVKPWGIVVPATRPNVIKEIKGEVKNEKILATGIGYQGARVGSGICNGADYEIIGRRITRSFDPLEEVRRIEREMVECE